MSEDIRGWLTDALARRTRHPALEQTLFNRLHELERGPLEQLAELVRSVVDELRLAQGRLAEQARDLQSLRGTVAVLSGRVDELAARVPATPRVAEGHVLLLPSADGYLLVQCEGPPPAPGDPVEHEGRRYRVLNRGRAGRPGGRPSLLALPD